MSGSAGTRSGAESSIQSYLGRIDLWLILVIVVGFALRWQYVHLPMAEAHSWRQITNADIARNFTEESANILYPQVSWGGPKDAYVSMEFPLLQWLAGMLFHVVRDREFVCRILSILFSLGTLVATYFLGARLFGAPAGRAAALSSGHLPLVCVLRPSVHLRHADGLLLGRRALGSRRLRSDPQSSCGMVGHRQRDAGVHGQDPGGPDLCAHRVARVERRLGNATGRHMERPAQRARSRPVQPALDRRSGHSFCRHGVVVLARGPAVPPHRTRAGDFPSVRRLLPRRRDRDGTGDGRVALEHAQSTRRPGVLLDDSGHGRITCT